MSKISVDKSFMDNPRAAQWKGYMEKMLKQNTEKNYILEFNSTESMYKEQAKLDVDDGRSGYNWMAQYVGDNIGKLYKNVSDKVTVNETEFMGRFFLLTDSISDQKWKMTGETKKMGKYTCYKATYEKEVKEQVFRAAYQACIAIFVVQVRKNGVETNVCNVVRGCTNQETE